MPVGLKALMMRSINAVAGDDMMGLKALLVPSTNITAGNDMIGGQ